MRVCEAPRESLPSTHAQQHWLCSTVSTVVLCLCGPCPHMPAVLPICRTATKPHLRFPECSFGNLHSPRRGTPGVLSAALGRSPREPLGGPEDHQQFTLTSAQDPLQFGSGQRRWRLSTKGRERSGTCFGISEIENTRERFGEIEKEAARNTANGKVAKVSNAFGGTVAHVCARKDVFQNRMCRGQGGDDQAGGGRMARGVRDALKGRVCGGSAAVPSQALPPAPSFSGRVR